MGNSTKKVNLDRFTVEVEKAGCGFCGHGELYRVVGPHSSSVEDLAQSTIFEDHDEAERLAQVLNDAYNCGAMRR